MGTLVAKLLLPTLSSLALLPAVSIAAKRRFHMEAMVYLFTMFFVAVSLGWGGVWGDPMGTPHRWSRGAALPLPPFPRWCQEITGGIGVSEAKPL